MMARLLRFIRRALASRQWGRRRWTVSSAEVLTLDQLDQWADCYAAPCHDLDCMTCRPPEDDGTDDCGCPEDCPEGSGHEWWCTR